MEVSSLRRMMRSNKQDHDNVTSRKCERWTNDKRRELQGMQFRSDGTARLASSITGMSVDSCRREAKRLGIQLATRDGHKQHLNVHQYLWMLMCQYLAIECSQDYKQVTYNLLTIGKVKDDAKLFPLLSNYYQLLGGFSLPKRRLSRGQFKPEYDDVLKRYHRLYSGHLISHMLGVSEHGLRARCRELGTACRAYLPTQQAQRLLLSRWGGLLLTPHDLQTITAESGDTISTTLSGYALWGGEGDD